MNFWKVFLASMLSIFVAMGLVFIILICAGVSLVASLDPIEDGNKANSVLYIDFADDIIDAPLASPLGTFDSENMTFSEPITMLSVIAALEYAAEDPNIKGICISPTGMGSISGANIEELRQAILQFKQSGKFVVAYDDNYLQSEYYLASVADHVMLHPEGSLEWRGVGTSLMFYKDMFDSLDIDVNIFRPTECRYKSAVEPYFRTDMSEENREQMERIAESSWQALCSNVAVSRNIDVATLNNYAENLTIAIADDALEARMVDALVYEDELFELFESYDVECDKRGNPHRVSLSEYLEVAYNAPLRVSVDNVALLDLESTPLVAVIYADGQIVDGNFYSDGYVFGNRLAEELRQARLNDRTKAVVLRVNSPGGSALASDVVWREMTLLQQTKPVVVSMGSMAASGGYYISTPADYIFTDHLTLTGSIGVFGMMFNLEDALRNKLGITFDHAGTSPVAGGMNPMRDMTEVEERAIMRGVDRVYETFTSHVAEGRNLTIEEVYDIAEGRVWSGTDAIEIGLADNIGGLYAALMKAVDLADLGQNFSIYEFVATKNPFDEWVSMLSAESARAMGINFDTYGRDIVDFFTKNPMFATDSGIQAIVAGDLKLDF